MNCVNCGSTQGHTYDCYEQLPRMHLDYGYIAFCEAIRREMVARLINPGAYCEDDYRSLYERRAVGRVLEKR